MGKTDAAADLPGRESAGSLRFFVSGVEQVTDLIFPQIQGAAD
jgi:hypothetical protein